MRCVRVLLAKCAAGAGTDATGTRGGKARVGPPTPRPGLAAGSSAGGASNTWEAGGAGGKCLGRSVMRAASRPGCSSLCKPGAQAARPTPRRKHNVLTCVCLTKKNSIKIKKVITKVTFKRLNKQEIEEYLLTNEWKDKAGAYAIQGYAEKFIKRINGSYSNVVGLPLFETYNLLNSQGLI